MENNKFHVLVVDDDNKIRDLIKQFLNLAVISEKHLNSSNRFSSYHRCILSELSLDKSCYNPHLNKRAINTASSVQVREKIYTGSSIDWKIYRDLISPKILNLMEKNQLNQN